MSMTVPFRTALVVTALAATTLVAQSESLDLPTIARLRQEGYARSQVMDHIGWLADVYGPRMTGTPALARASEWAMKQMTAWGLENVHQEKFAFGQGWSVVRFSAHLLEPQVQPLAGVPRAFSPSMPAPVTADVVRVSIGAEADFARYRDKLRGKIVLMQPARAVTMLEGPIVLRLGERELKEAAETTPVPPAAAATADAAFADKVQAFLVAEGVAALLDRGADGVMEAGGSDLSWVTQRTDGGTIFPGTGGSRDPKAPRRVPSATLAVEHYNRLVRLLERGVPVKLELDIRTEIYPERDGNGINTIGEIRGTDVADEVVMLGAHLDSVHAAQGATDNATGSAAMLEAMRLIKAVGAKPRRTIRIALWAAEEQGLLGSRAYVKAHFADRETMQLQPEHAKLSAYFNLDNGTGRIRGIWLQGNLAVGPIFEQWMAPLRDLGVTTIGPRPVASTDHASFDEVGLPGFQFMQDRLEYNSRTHHSNMDTVDRVQRDDMVQQATVAAIFAYDAAMRPEKLPRKLLPTSTKRTGTP